ncbi:hypothetical protein ESCO_004913 [Escovopsis weberi]|uniref:Secreted metallopeptidase n=1 Tax=Escovopsis weberi TaxID=150374 RepID=A0A0N0RSW1_ESCWE|nr:hypothetical protein ESCO_004913 [Escovopsis weberi]
MQLPLAGTAVLAAAGSLLAGQRVDHQVELDEPFAVIDPQRWVNPDNMTWSDYTPPPGTHWGDPSRKGSVRNWNIALVALDFPDKRFVVQGPPRSNVFGNPQPSGADVPRDRVPAFYRDLLNAPGGLNGGHTLHEYWMEDSQGRYGVELTAFGPYRLPRLSYEYGIDSFNPGACPPNRNCSQSIRRDGQEAWLGDVGGAAAGSFELVFYLAAGEDESALWQEFGEMRFDGKEAVPDALGPPRGAYNGGGGSGSLPNYAATRYVEWTSWAAAASTWANAGGGSSVQSESDGMGTFAHELSHLLKVGDNYNNPYAQPPGRDYTGPWSMMSRGTFNGPGGPHTRYEVPPLRGAAMGSLHTVRDKLQLGLVAEDSVVRITRDELGALGPVVVRITARCVVSDLIGLRVEMDEDRSPECRTEEDFACDGGGWEAYDVEVVDRMGADSFQPDSGVMISKTRADSWADPFQWVVDANPQDIELVDFIRPNGSAAMVTRGDYRQLADALFHAGTRSGSAFEYVDEPNGLHFYVLDRHRDGAGVLSYDVAVRSLNSTNGSVLGVEVSAGTASAAPSSPSSSSSSSSTEQGFFCSFEVANNGTYVQEGEDGEPISGPPLSSQFGSDIFRLETVMRGSGWRVEVRNALVAVPFGASVSVSVGVGAGAGAESVGVVELRVASESDAAVTATAECMVQKA